jgi:hypothetical protein
MEAEHCSKDEFETSNYTIRTCPKNEWDITVCGNLSLADMRHARRLEAIDELMRKEIARSAGLTRCEVIAVALYTGPMVSCKSLRTLMTLGISYPPLCS